MLLLDAAQELHRSSSGDDEDVMEPSTAGSPPGELLMHCEQGSWASQSPHAL